MRLRYLGALMALVVAGCGSSDAAPDTPKDHVIYLTTLAGTGRDAFVAVAKEKGFYAKYDLDVEVQPGRGTVYNLGLLRTGKVSFSGMDGMGGIIEAGLHPAARDYKLIMALQKSTLVSVMSTDSTIGSPKDLEGRTIGMPTATINQLLFPAYAKLAGFDASKVRLINFEANALIMNAAAGKVDAVGTYLLQQATFERQASLAGRGEHANVLPLSTYMSDLIGGGIYATDATLKGKPDLVRRFREATVEGVKFMWEHPDETAAIHHRLFRGTPEVDALGEIKAAKPYMIPSAGPMGGVTQAQITKAIALCRSMGIFTAPLTPSEVVDVSAMPVS